MGALLSRFGVLAANLSVSVMLLIGTIGTALIKSDLRRQEAGKAVSGGAIWCQGETSGVCIAIGSPGQIQWVILAGLEMFCQNDALELFYNRVQPPPSPLGNPGINGCSSMCTHNS